MILSIASFNSTSANTIEFSTALLFAFSALLSIFFLRFSAFFLTFASISFKPSKTALNRIILCHKTSKITDNSILSCVINHTRIVAFFVFLTNSFITILMWSGISFLVFIIYCFLHLYNFIWKGKIEIVHFERTIWPKCANNCK